MFRRIVVIFILLFGNFCLAALAHPTMSGRVQSVAGGVLTLTQKGDQKLTFRLTEAVDPGVVRAGAMVSVQVIGSIDRSKTMKAGKVVPWGNSAEIISTGARAPGYTPTGDYPTTAGPGGMPLGAPGTTGSQTSILGEIGNGGSGNMPTPPGTLPSSSGPYNNQGEAMTAPLNSIQVDPYKVNR